MSAATPLLPEEVAEYIRMHWPVLPVWGFRGTACACGKECKTPGKHPIWQLTEHGVKDATVELRKVTLWAQQHDGNWGIAMGHPLPDGGYLFALDVDPRNHGDENLRALERAHQDLPHTVTQITGGGGQHLLFWSPVVVRTCDLAEGVEVKGLGNYIVAAPSMHRSGKAYAWDLGYGLDTEIAKAPAWLLGLIEREHKPDFTAPTVGTAADSLLGEAFRLAGWLGGGLSRGKRAVRCPWLHEHTDGRGDGRDSSTVLLPPREGNSFGGFVCQHSHCAGRGWKDVFDALPKEALAKAREKYARPRAAPEPAAETPSGGSPQPGPKRFRPWSHADIWAPIEPPKYAVEGFLREGSVTILSAYAGTGKTFLVADLQIAIATGEKWLGMFQCIRGKSILLDYESGSDELRRRYHAIAKGRGAVVPEGGLSFDAMPSLYATDDEFEAAVLELAKEYQVIVLDSLRASCTSMDENASEMRIPLDRLRRVAEHTKCVFVIISHAKKKLGEVDDRETVRGSSAIVDAVDNLITAKKTDKGILLSHSKSRQGKEVEPFLVRILGHEPEPIQVVGESLNEDKDDPVARMRSKLVGLFAENHNLRTKGEVQRAAGCRRETVMTALEELMAHEVVVIHNRAYRLRSEVEQ